MQGLKIGHVSSQEKGTGVSVFLFDPGSAGACWVCGSAPATHELAVLDPENSVPHLDGLVLSGGSAYGLYAAKGVMTYLTEQGRGCPTPHGVVPIVPAAALYDLDYKKAIAPTEEEAYQACREASEDNMASGRIGAGTGATIGKLVPDAKHMSGGLGRAEMTLPDGVQVVAYAAVNCVGDVRDKAGRIVAGARLTQDEFADCEKYLLSGEGERDLFQHSNTTLVAVFTNAKFDKSELKRIAKMATAGIARAIAPIFTRFDGDILFCISVGERMASDLTIGTLAAEIVRLAIVDAVKHSETVT
ncbi:putative aminopeptidase [Aquicella lusitana]|uniref:L-aminopeptidase/D-esterase-like protein n=2 Tax=Aquicella lusitana TaxID=254246 RepID=A0A370GTA8_9COXI|nr:L-aminopeptidase/D-esterase-like protein [Aquicella lusitana]VVC72767.1 putative aminopeptidase [Aquicella lusitana]